MRDLTPDARRILAVFAAATVPLDWYDAVLQIAEESKISVSNYASWVVRRDHLTAEVMLLMRDGMLAEVEDAAVDMCVITEAGREAYLTSAQRAERKAQDALGTAHREAAATLASLNKPSGPEGPL